MTRLSVVTFFLFVFGHAQAQLTGHIFDETHHVIPGANVLLIQAKDSALIKAVITDDTGLFSFVLPPGGNCKLIVAVMGYSRYYSDTVRAGMIDLTLSPEAARLKTIDISSTQPFIVQQPDRIVVNVQHSIVAAGNNVLEVLKQAPNVSVDKDGNISVKGKPGTLVLLDNKPTYLNASELADLLKTIEASQTEKIEIITNPSSQYDAAGNAGIINIVLKKGQRMGLNAQFNAALGKTVTKGNYNTGTLGYNLNYKRGKWNLFNSYNYRNDEQFWHGEVRQYFQTDILSEPHTSTHGIRLGADLIT